MKREKLKIIINGFIVIVLFFGVVVSFINNSSVEAINREEPDYMKFDVPPEEEFLEDEEKQDYYLEDEEAQENKETEDFHKEYEQGTY